MKPGLAARRRLPQRNLIQLEFSTAGAICARVFDELRIRVVTPADLVDQPVGAVVDLPFQKLSQLMLGILQRAGVPEASVDSLSNTIAQRIQLLRAFPNPDKTLEGIEARILDVVKRLPKTAAEIERGRNPGDVLDPYLLAAPPWSETNPLKFHQIKSKTGSAKGGDGKRLGDQLQRDAGR